MQNHYKGLFMAAEKLFDQLFAVEQHSTTFRPETYRAGNELSAVLCRVRSAQPGWSAEYHEAAQREFTAQFAELRRAKEAGTCLA